MYIHIYVYLYLYLFIFRFGFRFRFIFISWLRICLLEGVWDAGVPFLIAVPEDGREWISRTECKV